MSTKSSTVMESLDVVNDRNEVIGSAQYSEVYARNLPHRIVHILIFNSDGRLALQKSSAKKTFCPQHWGTPVGGHVQAGESYNQAAIRECKEELGVSVGVKPLWTELFTGTGYKKFLGIFRAEFDGPFVINPEEVERADFFTLAEIRQMIENGEKFHPELLFILEREFGIVRMRQ